jgi:hypothetical protein
VVVDGPDVGPFPPSPPAPFFFSPPSLAVVVTIGAGGNHKINLEGREGRINRHSLPQSFNHTDRARPNKQTWGSVKDKARSREKKEKETDTQNNIHLHPMSLLSRLSFLLLSSQLQLT